jgi:aminoglycoside phosphotransferase (APT) family kinase protein
MGNRAWRGKRCLATVLGMIDAPVATDGPDPATVAFVARSGLLAAGAAPHFARLEGGVSSDIWLVRGGGRVFCVKRALPRLRVAADWQAPVGRNANEAAWLKAVAEVLPEAAPAVLAEDAEAGVFAMPYLPPADYRIWKEELRRGRVDPAIAAEVGRRLARIHAAFANSPAAAAEFANDAVFHAIRLEPYLLATARAHRDLADPLEGLAATTAATKLTLVHGDVSPKNILVGPQGPVFIDAECAWFGDPAFDIAFCLNHLLLKCLWVPGRAPEFLRAFDALAEAYLKGACWEPRTRLEARAAALLPGLFLARIDGKSPVEYVTEARDKDKVRRIARALLLAPPARLADIRQAWASEVGA